MSDSLFSYEKELEELRLSSRNKKVVSCEIPVVSEIKPIKPFAEWPDRIRELIEWFLSCESLPKEPFFLRPAVKVCDPERFYAFLREDIARGFKGIGWRLGELERDLKSLIERLSCKQ